MKDIRSSTVDEPESNAYAKRKGAMGGYSTSQYCKVYRAIFQTNTRRYVGHSRLGQAKECHHFPKWIYTRLLICGEAREPGVIRI